MTDALANVAVVLCQTTHPGNIGAAARAMLTMGFGKLRLVRPRSFPDAVATAMASGADAVLDRTEVFENLGDALADTQFAIGLTARRRDLSHEVSDVRDAATALAVHAAAGSVALVFGTEMSGLSNEELGHCRLLACIPANPEFSSLNLAAAVQVACYEARRAVLGSSAGAVVATRRELARAQDVEDFYRHLEHALVASGFLDPDNPRRLMARLRRLYARTGLEKEEVNILRGILTAVGYPAPPADDGRTGGVNT